MLHLIEYINKTYTEVITRDKELSFHIAFGILKQLYVKTCGSLPDLVDLVGLATFMEDVEIKSNGKDRKELAQEVKALVMKALGKWTRRYSREEFDVKSRFSRS